MKVWFHKITATGNDFIVVDAREGLALSPEQIRDLCDRRMGIGADGMLFLHCPQRPGQDFRMHYCNADGSAVEMCGNGVRAISYFYHQLEGGQGDYTLETQNSVYSAQVCEDFVQVQMSEVREPGAIEVGDLVPGAKSSYYINTGVPHCVYQVSGLADFDVAGQGKRVRDDSRFQRGTNCNFFELVGEQVHIRTFERGVEGETLACGTGAVAVALSLYLQGERREHYQICTLGGPLTVQVRSPQQIYLGGRVKRTFSGEFVLEK